MIEILKSILLGIVEGITEWLPISSTGHLILLNEFINLQVSTDPQVNESFMQMYNVVIQLGAILAVIVLFFHKLNPFSQKKDKKTKGKDLEPVVQGCGSHHPFRLGGCPAG